ncbi:MAG: SUMF1/EgtB/PvdO family nonheme iron enzyme [Spirosomataceae bacterium]
MRTFFFNLLFPLLTLLSCKAPAFSQTKSWKTIDKSQMPAGTERRLALVVGNKDYSRADARLQNPLNDANDVAAALEALGFDVIKHTNLTLAQFKKAADDFGARLANYNVALFYYSGHGLQFNGENYLVPVDANLQALSDAEDDCLRLGRVMGKMKAANVKNNIVFLDACRDNPFPKTDGTKGQPARGLIIPNNPAGTMVVFATEEGRTADDNAGARNGLFTGELLKHIGTPNLSLSDIVLNTRQGVYEQSRQNQLPADYNKMLGAFYFVKTAANAPAEPYTPSVRTEPTKPVVDLEPVAMRYIMGGSFEMGSSEGEADEKPVHRVTVKGFRMATYETTVGEFEKFIEASDYKTDAEKEGFSYVWNGKEWEKRTGINWRHGADGSIQSNRQHPVINVSHNDAVAYCEWLTRKTGKTYRLPTEAEWEYAAGNGSTHRKYSWGNSATEGVSGNVADETGATKNNWTKNAINIFLGYDDGYAYTAPVGKFKANDFGLHDMTGNVREWCADWYGSDHYTNSGNSSNPTGPTTGFKRVIRGGSWDYDPTYSCVANRDFNAPSFRTINVGFRVVSFQ